MRKVVALLVVFALMGVSVAVARSYLAQQINSPLAVKAPTLYEVAPGDNAYAMLHDFNQQGWTDIPSLVGRIWLKFLAGDTAIKAGVYQLTASTTLSDALNIMVAGKEHQFDVGLVEGLRLSDWLTALRAHSAIDYDIGDATLQTMVNQWPYAPETGIDYPEGLFLADTYHFTHGTKASDILQRAMQAMLSYLDQAWQRRAPMLPLSTPYEALVLASIIEKETAVDAERPHIAGVFVNRLEKNMRLQTDPTVIYGLGENFDGNLTRAHLRDKTPYNTYVIRGLPPTPIAMAGRPAIDAALNPLLTDDLYFVARGDGSHKFSATLEEHNQAVYEFQIKPNQ